MTMGWALKHLSAGERERIARGLFSVQEVVTRGDAVVWLNGLCPLHDDRNPSFGYNVEADVYHCLTGCSKDGDLVDLFCRVRGLDATAGFVAFKREFGRPEESGPGGATRGGRRRSSRQGGGASGSSPGGAPDPLPGEHGGGDDPGGDPEGEPVGGPGGEPGSDPAAAGRRLVTGKKKAAAPPVDYDQLAEAYRAFAPLPEGWIKRLAERRGWSREAIGALGIRLQTRYRDKATGDLRAVSEGFERIALPVYDADGVLRNIRLYRPDAAENKIISWAAGYGENRLWPWPERGGSGLVWLCEGETDTVCARSHGLEAYTQTAKRKNWPAEQCEPFRGRDVVIAYDADLPGQQYARAAAKSLLPYARSVRTLVWPDYMMGEDGELPAAHGQDLTDFFVRHGKTVAALTSLLPLAHTVQEDDPLLGIDAFFGPTYAGRVAFQPRLLAEQLLKDCELLHDPTTGLLYRWDGSYYAPYDPAQLKRQAIMYLGNESVQSRYEDAVKQAILLSTVPDGRAVNDRPDLQCLQNGMFNLDSYELTPHDKDHLSTIKIDLAFNPDAPPPCPRWQRYLAETVQTPGAIEQLQEFFGLCLTRETRYEMALFMIGDGGDGKSTAQKVLRALVGAENCTSVSFDGLEDQFQRALLYNKLINLSSEVGGKAMDSEYFKKIISGDSITAAFKHKDGFEFEPFVKLVFAVNKMPKVIDSSDGLYRRILPIWFKRQFLPGDPARDPHLIEKLLAELPGIFGWSLAGLARLRRRGTFDLSLPETQELLAGYRRQNSPVYAFVEFCCVTGDDYEASKEDLYKAYRTFCANGGYGAVHRENFFQDLRRAVKTLRNCRPRGENGERLNKVRGIGLVANEFST